MLIVCNDDNVEETREWAVAVGFPSDRVISAGPAEEASGAATGLTAALTRLPTGCHVVAVDACGVCEPRFSLQRIVVRALVLLCLLSICTRCCTACLHSQLKVQVARLLAAAHAVLSRQPVGEDRCQTVLRPRL